jgi:membrane protease YdiL (CAAX protease family)
LVFTESPHLLGSESTEDHQALTRLMVFYLILLATNIYAAIAARTIDQTQPDEAIAEERLHITLAVEVIDTFIVLISLTMIPRPPRWNNLGIGRRLACWGASPAILAALLGINLGYHWLLNSYVQFPEWANLPPEDVTPLLIVAICIQPAIIEELFFRYLALGTLRRVMGVGAAICVSSIMFGMAHSGAALSIPILTVIGGGLALARVWSGGLMLPMILHALHNGAVLYFERNL